METDTYILCIETSGPDCSVAISNRGLCIAHQEAKNAWHHSQYLTTYILDSLDSIGITVDDLSAIAISHGPGSYTGLRVGAATAKGICYAKDIPLISINTLKIIACPLVNNTHPNTKILATIDARRDEIYYNIYDNQLNALISTESHILTPDSFSDLRDEKLIITGDGTEKTKNKLKQSEHNHVEFIESYPSAQHMTMLAYDKYQVQLYEDIAYYSPFYMKPPNITTRKKPLF